MSRIAFVTAIESLSRDDDMPPLLAAAARAGLQAEVRAWDDTTVSWSRYDALLLRSPWDYFVRLPEFLGWCELVDRLGRLLNPLSVVRWNTDKHYLEDLRAAGIPVVPSGFVEPDAETAPLDALRAFRAGLPPACEVVVKPAVSAGSRDTQRYRPDQEFAAANHIGALLDAGRSVLLQPYLDSVDRDGETALLYFGGVFSHAIRKAALLRPNEAPSDHTQRPDAITPRTPSADELALGDAVMAAIQARTGTTLAYARVDLIRDADGQPCLLELEATEPSLFFVHAPVAADRLAAVLAVRLDRRRRGCGS